MTEAAFFYGTLMSHVVIGDVLCGKHAPAALKSQKLNNLTLLPATLHRAKRFAVKHASYPGVLPTDDDNDQVLGLVCTGLTPADVRRLDDYEGDEYERKAAQVTVKQGDDNDAKIVNCQVYYWIAGKQHLLEDDWDFNMWKENILPTYEV
ncbi:Butirosin biosynthesis, BtrG-like protein [Gongronella butleri]|nr:Butirosin biosynthesis, BtrG-like protein [Gongronella butleri]